MRGEKQFRDQKWIDGDKEKEKHYGWKRTSLFIDFSSDPEEDMGHRRDYSDD